MNVMLLTSEGFDTPNSINHLLTSLCEDILKAKHNLHMVYSHTTGIYEDIPKQLQGYNNVNTTIVRRKPINRNNFVIRYLDEIRFAFTAYQAWRVFKHEIDVVILQSNPCSVYHAVLLKLFMRKPIVFNLYDIFPGHAFDIGVIRSRIVYQVLRVLQKLLYHFSDYVVAMSEDMRIKLLNEGIPETKIKVINNWFDDEMFRPIPRDRNRFMRKYRLDQDKFYIQFAGLLGYVFDAEMYINTAKKLENEENIIFLLVGDGNLREKVLDRIKEVHARNILYFPWQPLDIIADVYNACDIGYVPLKEGVIGYGIPSKACQLMAAEKVILNSVEESAYVELFRENDMGVSITDRNPDKAAQEILALYRNPNRMKVMGKKAAAYAYMHFSRSDNTAKFIDLLVTAANKTKGGT